MLAEGRAIMRNRLRAIYITMQPPLPAAMWESEVNKMNKTFGAGIPEENARKIFLYLQAHYTAENRKR